MESNLSVGKNDVWGFRALPSIKKFRRGEFPGGPKLPLQGAWVRSLVGELRPHKLRGEAKTKRRSPEDLRLGGLGVWSRIGNTENRGSLAYKVQCLAWRLGRLEF